MMQNVLDVDKYSLINSSNIKEKSKQATKKHLHNIRVLSENLNY